LPASRFLNPELANLEAASPRVSADSRDKAISVVPHEDRQPLAAGYARDARVELVDAIFQVLDLVRRGFSVND
jgi:hypothetical protein